MSAVAAAVDTYQASQKIRNQQSCHHGNTQLFKAELGGKIMREKAQKNYDDIVAENKRLREIVNNSEYEIDIAALQRQLDDAKREIERLKNR